MTKLSTFPERLQKAFDPTRRGVVGLVDDLLGLCRECGLTLDWQANKCRVHPLGTEQPGSIEIPLPKSVFRAILARVAALCNERIPNSVSPYGGDGELSFGTNPPTFFRVAFTNTPGEQRLEVRRLANDKDETTDDDAAGGGDQSTRTKNVELSESGACDTRLRRRAISLSGVWEAHDFRSNLIIDRYDPVFALMRARKLKHLRSVNSEDAVTWNVFRSLRQIAPVSWLPPLWRRRFRIRRCRTICERP